MQTPFYWFIPKIKTAFWIKMQIPRECLWESIINANNNLAPEPFSQKEKACRAQERTSRQEAAPAPTWPSPCWFGKLFHWQLCPLLLLVFFRERQSLSNRKYWNSFCKTSISLPLAQTRMKTTRQSCWTLQRELGGIMHNIGLTLVTYVWERWKLFESAQLLELLTIRV